MSAKNRMFLNQLMNNPSIVQFQLGDHTVYFDRHKLNVGYYEIKNQLNDLFKFKKSFKVKEIIKLSDIVDCMFNVRFIGRIENNLILEAI